jgi:hypothetical protein
MKDGRNGRLVFAVAFLLFFLSQASAALAQRWCFAVFSDNHHFEAAYRNVVENINAGGPANPWFPKPDFVVGAGDISPVRRTFQIFREVMGPGIPFIPVRGNHEGPEDLRFIINDILPAEKPPVSPYDKESATFYYDWKNVRLIVIDQYAAYSENMGGRVLLNWVETAIVSAKSADHVFIFFHEPYVPLDVYTDPFWSLLLNHRDKVRAVFWGHTHHYGRWFLARWSGGIDLINVGTAGSTGHSDGMNTYVEICMDGKEAVFRTVQAPDRTKDFKVTNTWKASAAGRN